ncbi:SusC/RagA family TonB-linked outer membrane protein [Panacibacter ginsenosidivorans]|uniref:SusC/RagA family TonB-linked outer membrane protein n=1 Tax=Panacibacter ginsenosidivorans TaxID=1813871 RepID=A0A5B8V6Q3_9BACT|nr:SusC/RagA family TonB-linked outer membrane protein [Panacibacter ginsenosidivorans]QEC66972.1 SusC/RagA family TonB-linked outer membrane protein [Panacibacter ginsenosidivorans]
MRKIVSFLLLLLLSTSIAIAQTRNITGKVTDENGSPIPFVSVKVKDGKTGVSADANGVFIIKASMGSTLVISSVGYTEKEVTVNAESISVTLARDTKSTISEVVVTTAFNIKKDQRTTPFSTQVIKSDALTIIPQSNLNDALAGKIAGVQFRSQSGAKLNSQSFARIRGGLLLSGDVGAIYVVDGTIVGDAYDIDPNSVESINVLKGANATALFGSRASNGAIIITTKKAAAGKTSIDVSQGLTFDRVNRIPHLQNSYAGGGSADLIPFTFVEGMPEEWRALDGKLFPDYTDDASWGPKMEGQEYVPWYAWVPGTKYTGKTASLVAQPDNIKDFFANGFNSNTNVNFYKSGQGYSTRLSFSKQFIQGIIPNSKSDRYVVSTSTSLDLNKYFTAGINLNFNTQNIYGEYDDGYANQTSGNFGQWNHRDLDMGIMKELQYLHVPDYAGGGLASWNWSSNPTAYDPTNPAGFFTGNYWYNFYSYMDNLDQRQRRDRLYGDVYLNFKLNSHFNIRGTVRRDQSNYYYENKVKSLLEKSATQTGLKAGFGTGERYQNETNYELIATYNTTFLKDFGLNLLAGGNVLTYLRKDLDASTVNGLTIYDLYALSNSVSTPNLSNSRLESRTNSLFASGDLEYKKFISATFAVRQDYNSTLPTSDNKLFYPSVGMSFIPSTFTKDALPWLSFAKVFGSWGKKPLALDIYALDLTYPINQNKWDDNALQTVSNTIPDRSLAGTTITSYEAGVELRFAKNKIGLMATYYNEKAADQPINIQVPGQSGFTTKTVNAATVERNGLEFTVDAKIVNRKDFTWSVTKTFGYLMGNKVTKLIEGTTRIQPSGWAGAFGSRYATAYQVLGEDWGQLIGGGMTRNEDGKALIDPSSGLYAAGNANYNWGNIVPKVTGGFQSLFTYKNFILNLSLDYQVGGKFFSLSESWGAFSGLLDYTAETNDRGKNVRDPLSEGGGVHVVGVSSVDSKTPVDMYVDGFTYFHQFYGAGIADPYVHDLSYLKLREVSLGYSIPSEKLGFMSNTVKGITVSLIARNPWLIYSASKNFDPSEISGVYGEDGQLPSVRSLGFNVKFNF